MKATPKNMSFNRQEDEDAEYILYPENAIADTNHKKQQQKRNDSFALKAKEPLKNINLPSSNSINS